MNSSYEIRIIESQFNRMSSSMLDLIEEKKRIEEEKRKIEVEWRKSKDHLWRKIGGYAEDTAASVLKQVESDDLKGNFG